MKKQLDRIQELENLISKLPQGSITYKTIHGKNSRIFSGLKTEKQEANI